MTLKFAFIHLGLGPAGSFAGLCERQEVLCCVMKLLMEDAVVIIIRDEGEINTDVKLMVVLEKKSEDHQSRKDLSSGHHDFL